VRTRCHRLDSLNNNFLSCEGWKSNIKAPDSLVSGEGFLPGWYRVILLSCDLSSDYSLVEREGKEGRGKEGALWFLFCS
jgi:hypothetical protein